MYLPLFLFFYQNPVARIFIYSRDDYLFETNHLLEKKQRKERKLTNRKRRKIENFGRYCCCFWFNTFELSRYEGMYLYVCTYSTDRYTFLHNVK